MKLKKFIAILISLVIILSSIGVLGASETFYLINETFDNYITNTKPDNVTISGKVRVIDDGIRNKALLINGEENNKLSYKLTQNFDKVILETDFKTTDESVDFKFGFYNSDSSAFTDLINVTDNIILTKDGKKIGCLSKNEYTRVEFVLRNTKKLYDIYINGKCVIKQWKTKALLGNTVMLQKTAKGAEDSLIMDNLRLYESEEILNNLALYPYNTSGDAYIDYNYNNNCDYTFIHTDYLSDVRSEVNHTYDNAIINEKTNKITLNRLKERYNPSRDNGYVIMEKTTDDDCHIDLVNINRKGNFAYYLIGGSVRIDKLGAPVRFTYIRDAISTNSQINNEVISINEKGQVILAATGEVLKNLKKGEWLNFAVALDIKNHSAKVYFDGKLAAETDSLNPNLKQPTMIRVWVDYGKDCTATFDGYHIIGMRKPYTVDDTSRTSFFNDDDGIISYLSDKTAFHAYSYNVFGNGKKNIRVDKKPILDEKNKELFVTAKALAIGYDLELSVDSQNKKAIGKDIEFTADNKEIIYGGKKYNLNLAPMFENDTLYIPVKEFALKVLKHYMVDDNSGLVITSANKFDIDLSKDREEYTIDGVSDYPYPYTNSRVINWFMMFERPKAEQIKKEFNETTNNGTMHPRVVVNHEDFERVIVNSKKDEVLKKWVGRIINEADACLTKPDFIYTIPDKQRILDGARNLLNIMGKLGFAYQVTGEQKYADGAWRFFQQVGAFPDWNPSHMIDPAEINAACAIGYDWMYDGFTEEQRSQIYKITKEMGMIDARNAYYGRLGGGGQWANNSERFVDWKSNFNTVINGGVMAAAVAFADRDPEFCFDILEKGLRSLEFTMISFSPNGIWAEGNGYWEYANSYLSKGLGSVITSTGQHYGLLDAQGVADTAMYYRSMDSYGGNNNFHDSGQGRLSSSFMGWYAKTLNQPVFTLLKKSLIESSMASPTEWDALWYYADYNGSEDDLPLDYHADGIDTLTIRGSYTDNDALYFSTHGGFVFSYHTQADVATYVLDLMGVRWASDLGAEDYNIQRDGSYAGYYTAYRRRAEAHNCMVFNPGIKGEMNDNGAAKMLDYQSKDRGAFAVYDLADVYDQVTEYKRGFYVGDNRRSLTIRDEFTTNGDMPSYWFLTTQADVEIIDNNNAVLTKGGKKLKLELVTTSDNYSLSVGKAEPLPTSPVLKGQNANLGYSRIALMLNAKGNTQTSITVKLSPYGEEASKTEIMDIPFREWKIEDGEFTTRPNLSTKVILVNGRSIKDIATEGKVGIVEGKSLPVIFAEPLKSENTVEIIPGNPADEYTIVRVYSKDKTIYNDTYIYYKKTVSANLAEYEKQVITGVEVSSTPEPENHKANMIDNDFSTRWTTMAVGEWAIFDLGEIKEIDAIAMAFWRGDSRVYKYELFVSEDGETWSSVASGANSGKTEGYENVEFRTCKSRYVKFVGGGNSDNVNSNILELSVMKKK